MGSKNMILKLGVFLNSPVDGSFSDETVQKVADLAGCVTAYFTEMQGAYREEIDKILETEKLLPALHGGIEKKYLLKLLKTWMETIMPYDSYCYIKQPPANMYSIETLREPHPKSTICWRASRSSARMFISCTRFVFRHTKNSARPCLDPSKLSITASKRPWSSTLRS